MDAARNEALVAFVRKHLESGTAVTPYIDLAGFQRAIQQLRKMRGDEDGAGS